MARALHDPVHGYYARNIRGIGSRGDFTTAPQLSEAPGKAVAAWVARALRETGARDVIEIGPGLGTLARQVIAALSFGLRLRTRFHLVESSPRLREKQRELLGRKVRHHATIHEALERCSGEAVIFSNELVDAFPIRLFEKRGGSWLEIGLDHSSGHPVEIFLPPAALPPLMRDLASHYAAHGIRVSERHGRIRYSFHLYNTHDEVETVLAVTRRWPRLKACVTLGA